MVHWIPHECGIERDQMNAKHGLTIHYRPGFSGQLPWRRAKFDCFVIPATSNLSPEILEEMAQELVSLNNDWIEVFGPASETIHDMLDNASVFIGRQKAVGEGLPMTAWHEDICELRKVAEYIRSGGHGYQKHKLILILGDDHFHESVKMALGKCT
jgi:hypothetical protein